MSIEYIKRPKGRPKKIIAPKPKRPIELKPLDIKRHLHGDLMSITELAQYLSISRRTIHRKLKTGEIPRVRIGNLWKFSKDDIDIWITNISKEGKI